MRKIEFSAILLILLSFPLYAASDRFGSERTEVPRSSFTDTTTGGNVVISSVPSDGNGSLVLRAVIFSGMRPSTVTFYDANLFEAVTTTRTRLEYTPVFNTTGGSGSLPTRVNVDMWFSSALMYNKIGAGPVTILYDWLAPSRLGDPRK